MIGLLYESNEWSDYHLAAELECCGCAVEMIDMTGDGCEKRALSCEMLVSRVFASAYARGHEAALEKTPRVLAEAERCGIRVVNPARAHGFETSKARSTAALAASGVPVPKVYGVLGAGELACGYLPSGVVFPVIAKPDCGGRGGDTVIAHDAGELTAASARLDPKLQMIVEEYVEPTRGYLTRIEVVGGEPVLVLKRSVAANGLSGYHHGSVYSFYPDCSDEVLESARAACRVLSFEVGSFDVIEGDGRIAFIDCNSVSNVSEDCTELFKMDLMREHARYIAGEYKREIGERNAH